jgi:hypothetical protein
VATCCIIGSSNCRSRKAIGATTSSDPAVLKRVLASANSLGYARAERWSPGIPVDTGFAFAEPITSSQTSCSKVDPELTQAVSASITEHMGQHSKTLVGIDGTISQPRHLDRGMEMSEVTQILEKIATAVEPTEEGCDCSRSTAI